MGVTPAFLQSLATFYDLFATSPIGRNRVLVCHNISCWMRGADDLLVAFCEATGADHHDADHHGASSPDGEFFVKGFECLGACDLAPMASINQRYYGPLDAADVVAAIAALRDGEEPLPEKALARRGPAAAPDAPGVRRTRCLRPGSCCGTSTTRIWRRSRATGATAATRRSSAPSRSSSPTS